MKTRKKVDFLSILSRPMIIINANEEKTIFRPIKLEKTPKKKINIEISKKTKISVKNLEKLNFHSDLIYIRQNLYNPICQPVIMKKNTKTQEISQNIPKKVENTLNLKKNEASLKKIEFFIKSEFLRKNQKINKNTLSMQKPSSLPKIINKTHEISRNSSFFNDITLICLTISLYNRNI